MEEKHSAKTYVDKVVTKVKERNPNEPEFYQAVEELAESLIPILSKHAKYMENAILERMVEPDRMITFRVAWIDDEGSPK